MGVCSIILDFFPVSLLYFLTALFSYNSCTIKLTHLKYMSVLFHNKTK